MKLRAIIAIVILFVIACGEYSLGKVLDSNVFLASALIVLGLSRA